MSAIVPIVLPVMQGKKIEYFFGPGEIAGHSPNNFFGQVLHAPGPRMAAVNHAVKHDPGIAPAIVVCFDFGVSTVAFDNVR